MARTAHKHIAACYDVDSDGSSECFYDLSRQHEGWGFRESNVTSNYGDFS